MPRRSFGQEAFHMEHLRSSPSQQHLDPTSASSTSSQHDQDGLENEMATVNGRGGSNGLIINGGAGLSGELAGQIPHKLDLYSIPVFLLECLILSALAYGAYYIHYIHEINPFISGFYCDDISLRKSFNSSIFTQQFKNPDNEKQNIVLLMAVPIVVIVFCELVNSMFGSLKFRQISALCKCCKLHSITRRTLRFSGAFLLGFALVMISCHILATSAGRFRPYFAQECPMLYDFCNTTVKGNTSTKAIQPPSAPITKLEDNQTNNTSNGALQRNRRDTFALAHFDNNEFVRKWIDLSGKDLVEKCGIDTDRRQFMLIAMSWPSLPSALVSFALFYLASYLSFVGTARPFRLLTSVLVVALLMATTIFNVQLVKENYNHWEDVAAGSGLAAVMVLLILTVYLNKFRDTHYYENQKMFGSANKRQQQLRRSMMMMADNGPYNMGYSNEIGHYHLDKVEGGHINVASAPVTQNLPQNGIDHTGGSGSNNDLAMRYFQIPRANYRGAPRPLSSVNARN